MNDFNAIPDGLKEVSLEEWKTGMFQYCTEPKELRQIFKPERFDLILFDVPNFRNKKLGYAVKDYYELFEGRKIRRTSFVRYGLDHDWKDHIERVVALNV